MKGFLLPLLAALAVATAVLGDNCNQQTLYRYKPVMFTEIHKNEEIDIRKKIT